MLENEVRRLTGQTLIAGLDEAGRGALVGPVVAAAVILPLDDPERLAALAAVNDSKQLTARRREHYYELIVEHALAYGIGSASALRIDNEGIVHATQHAMLEALKHLRPTPQSLLIDGLYVLTNLPLPQQAVVRGDSLSLSIAAASILAKVTRDRFMVALDPLYPQYGFASHKGYATAQHLEALERFGPISLHRHSFAPVRQKLL